MMPTLLHHHLGRDRVEHIVTVLREGFEFQGRTFQSLSAVARTITGTRWNGWRFFGLREIGRDKP